MPDTPKNTPVTPRIYIPNPQDPKGMIESELKAELSYFADLLEEAKCYVVEGFRALTGKSDPKKKEKDCHTP